VTARAPAGHRTRTGLLPEHRGVAAPVYDELRLTVPAREALVRHGNEVELRGATTLNGDARHAPEDTSVPPSKRRGHPYQVWRVTLRGTVPDGLVLCLVGQGGEQHRALRLHVEPEYPGEWPAAALAWHERGAWVPCPACQAPLVWYEAGYVPGYRVCAAKPHHHVQLGGDGTTARLVTR
jgi:hypothetical protein